MTSDGRLLGACLVFALALGAWVAEAPATTGYWESDQDRVWSDPAGWRDGYIPSDGSEVAYLYPDHTITIDQDVTVYNLNTYATTVRLVDDYTIDCQGGASRLGFPG